MKEVQGNNLVIRDEKTNAAVPVMQAYSEAVKKEIEGNRLVVRDPDTNAIVPVVYVQTEDWEQGW
jgi:hypothetical protein